MDIDYTIISTGSKGNAVLIEDSVLIDCGVPYKAIEPYVKGLKLVLLTHIHGDHFKPSTVKRLAENRPALRFVCGAWMVVPLVEAGVDKRNIDVLKENTGFCYQYVSIEHFNVTHDVPNCGYKILLNNGGKVLYVTDAGNLNGITARGYDLYMIEGDYDEEEIERRISEKKAEGQFAYERRVKDNHLSRAQCVEFVLKNGTPDSKFVYLHQHKEEEK